MNFGVFLILMSAGVSYMCFHVIREIALPELNGHDSFGRAWARGAIVMLPIACIGMFVVSFEAYEHGKESLEWESCIAESRREGWELSKELDCYDLRYQN